MGGGLVPVLVATGFVRVSWSKRIALQRGQAQGPRIRSTPLPVPTGRGRFHYLVRSSKIIGCAGV